MRHWAGLATLALAATACGGGGGTGAANNQAVSGRAASNDLMANASGAGAASGAAQPLRAADGAERGTVTVTQTADGLQVRVQATGLTPGPHGVHLHTTGRCDPPDFASAGPHWNPTNRQHGSENPAGPHQGDMPNMTVGADGSGTLEFALAGAAMSGGNAPIQDADGTALVIHAGADDYRTDPSGNSGDRIACAVIAADG